MFARSCLATLLVIVPIFFFSNANADNLVRYELEAETTKGTPIAPNAKIPAGH